MVIETAFIRTWIQDVVAEKSAFCKKAVWIFSLKKKNARTESIQG